MYPYPRMGMSVAFTLCLLITVVAGCAPFSPCANGIPGGWGGDFGATQGGLQDMGFARELVDAGRVPPPEAFVVEGKFSEHDLGLSGAFCERTLCLRGALGVAPDRNGEPSGWLQIGLSSSIDMETFDRPSLTLIATVDVSGSMSWSYATDSAEYGTPLAIAQHLLTRIADQLEADDRIAIVTYGSTVATPLELTNGTDQDRIDAAIHALRSEGSTDMESGLRRAYAIANSALGSTEQVRVMVFTDVQPNVGATTATEFSQIAQAGASEGVGITVMAVGVGIGQDVLNGIVHVRGGNAFSLFNGQDVEDLMADDWPWLVCPIAYDLSVSLTPSAGFELGTAYGFPAGPEDEEPGLDVSTVFLSKRKGALLVQLQPAAGQDMAGLAATAHLSYEAANGERVEEDLHVSYGGGPVDDAGRYFDQPGVGKTVALALLVEGMREAAELYSIDQPDAVATLTAAIERFEADAQVLGDTDLDAEIEFANDLLALMEAGAEQGDLYGYGYLGI